MTVFTSVVLRDMWGTEEMRQVFSDESRIAKFLKIEVALAKVEAGLGVIPADAYPEIERRSREFKVDWERLKRDTETVGYPVLPFLRQMTEICGPAGEYLHWGSNTRDITDTTLILQLRDALDLIEAELRGVKQALIKLTEEHRDTITIGRTHGMHALPTTFGMRAAIWLAEVDRQIVRLNHSRDSVKEGQFGGAVGNFSAIGEKGLAVQRALMHELGLEAPVVSWFASRDRIADVVCTIAQISSSMAGIGRTILSMARNEVGEASEPAVKGRGASSSMPQKHNTVCSEFAIVYARYITQMLPMVFEAMVQDYDRDYQGHFETVTLPQVFIFGHAGLKQMRFVLEGLHVHVDRMRENFNISRGYVMSESVMMVLAPKIGRKKAHGLVTEAVNFAMEHDLDMKAALRKFPGTSAHLTDADIEYAVDPANYIGLSGEVIDNVLKAARDTTS